MPEFEPRKNGRNNGRKDNLPEPRKNPLGEIVIAQCHVCQSDQRRAIDRMLAIGTSYSEIERMFGMSRRSISNHDKSHLAYHDSALRKVLAEEAEKLEQNIEEGMSGILRRRVILETALQKGMEALANGELEPEIKDLLGVIQQLDSYDARHEGQELEKIQVQFVAFRQAIQETQSPEQWNIILNRTKEILGDDSGPAELPPGS